MSNPEISIKLTAALDLKENNEKSRVLFRSRDRCAPFPCKNHSVLILLFVLICQSLSYLFYAVASLLEKYETLYI